MIPTTQIMTKPDIASCPLGFIFRGSGEDREKEQKYFPDMEAPLNHPHWFPGTYFYIIEDEEGKALENIAKHEATIVTKDFHLSDYRVEASVRQFIFGALPNCDDEYSIVARNGVIFRMQDLRRYYQLCLEGYDRLVLYARWDYNRVVLAEERFPIDPSRYHHLVAEVKGNRIRCWCDDRLVFDVWDDTYSRGLAGIRTNSICRFRDICVSTWDEGYSVYISNLESAEKKLAEVRESIPQPIIWKDFDLSQLGTGRVHFFQPIVEHATEVRDFGSPRCSNDKVMLMGSIKNKNGLSLFNLNGELLWEAPNPFNPDGSGVGEFKFADVDGDGIKEIVCLWSEGISIQRSTTGELAAKAPFPEPGPYSRTAVPSINHIYPGDLEGTGYYQSIVIKDDSSAGGWTFWVYDASLNLKWTRTLTLPPMGHNINLHDVDNDGREEILAGYHCYNGDGEKLWTVEQCQYWDAIQGARHPDSVIAGEFVPGCEKRAAYAGGGEGFVLVDATNGKLLRKERVGHAQGVMVGKFDKNMTGTQILIGTRHQNYGILCYFSGDGEPIGRYQPDYISQGGPIINWTGDGTEYVLLTSSQRAYGLWDVYGNHVMDFKELPIYADGSFAGINAVTYPVDITGDRRDEFAVIHKGRLFIFTQAKRYEGEKIYAPIRNERVIYPAISFERWVDNDEFQ